MRPQNLLLQQQNSSVQNVVHTITGTALREITVTPYQGTVTNIGNHYYNANIRDDTTTWPENTKLFDKAEWAEAVWLSGADQAELYSEWITVGTGQYLQLTNATAGGAGGGHYNGAGIYNNAQQELGRLTNTVDMSTIYDGVRAILWCYWTNADASDSLWLDIGQRSTKGSSSWGRLAVIVDRTLSSSLWGVWADNGNGTSGASNTTLNGNTVYAAVQAEFIAGQYIKMRVVNSGNIASFAAPTWPIATDGYYKSVDLSGAGYSGIVPMSPLLSVGSSQDQTVALLSRFAIELRRIGAGWQTLVDS